MNSPRLDTVLIKTSSRCNLNCTYCYVYNKGDDGWRDQPKKLGRTTVERIAERLWEQYSDQRVGFPVVLHGGEPLLLGKRGLKHLLSSLKGLLPGDCPIAIQTNGVLLDAEFVAICSDYEARISVSIDGPVALHDKARLNLRGKGTHADVLRGLDALKSHPHGNMLFSGTLTVIDPTSDPGEVYTFLKSLCTPSMDFLFQDGNHSRFPLGKSTACSTEYGSWLAGLFDHYVKDSSPPSIRILDDYIRLLLGGASIKEGVGENDFHILIIDTDGTVKKNDTLKSTGNRADEFATSWNVFQHSLGQILSSNEFQEYRKLQSPEAAECLNCTRLHVCGGGMPLYRWEDSTGFANPSVYCTDHKLIIDHISGYLNAYSSNTF